MEYAEPAIEELGENGEQSLALQFTIRIMNLKNKN